jgi:hypothetical protein
LGCRRTRRDSQDISYLVGEMENEIAAARLARRHMVDAAATAEPGEQTTNRVMTGRAILARSVIRSVEKTIISIQVNVCCLRRGRGVSSQTNQRRSTLGSTSDDD